jgi:hypothetical protein
VVSDDFLLVGCEAGCAELRGLRRDLYVREGSFDLIPVSLRARFSIEGVRPGWRVLRQDDAPELLVAAVRPRVVWFLDGTRCAAPVETCEISQAGALASMIATTSPLFVSGRYKEERARMLPSLTAIVESARCFKVRLGPALLDSPGTVVRELLAQTALGTGSQARST